MAQGPGQLPPAIICPVCGLRNDITARFCRNCGLPLGAPRDPVRGTATRRADLPSDRGTGIAAIVALVAIVAITGLAAFLVMRNLDGIEVAAGSSPTPGPTVPLVVGPSPGATRTPGPTDDATPGPDTTHDPDATRRPDATRTPRPTEEPEPTDEPEPTERPEPTATSLGTRTRFTCDAAAIRDLSGRRWRVARASWGDSGSADRLTLHLNRSTGTTRRGTTVRMEFLSPSRAASRYGVSRPPGDRAVVLTFDGPLTINSPLVGGPSMRALQSVDVRRDGDGVVHAVMGIDGDGCVRMTASGWDADDRSTTAEVVLEVRR